VTGHRRGRLDTCTNLLVQSGTVAIVSVDPKDRTPIYAPLERAPRAAIAPGRLTTGDQLPTVRQLAVELSINANTVARVYAELERAGILETRRGVRSEERRGGKEWR